MDKIYRFVIGSFFVAVVLLSLATNQAQALDSRCDADIWDIQLTHAESMVVKDTALTAETIPQNDSTLALTCFDQAMVMSAKAGEIFSDVIDPPSFASLTSIATGLGGIASFISTGVDAGSRGSTLMADLSNTIGDVLENLMDDFIGAVTSAISGLISSGLTALFGSFLGGALSGIFGLLSGASFSCDFMQDTWDNDIIGNGLKSVTSFLSNDELFDYAGLASAIPGMVSEFQGKLDNPANFAILSKAWDDLNNRLIPGGIPVYKTAPAIGVNSSLAAVLGAM